MSLRNLLPALMIGAGMLLVSQTPAQAKPKHHYKTKRTKGHHVKPYKHQARKVQPVTH
jgi:hypothetical protein